MGVRAGGRVGSRLGEGVKIGTHIKEEGSLVPFLHPTPSP